MLIKSDPTATNLSPAMPAATVCGNCGAEERRLLHQVRHRSIFRRLCTTCVLRLHPQAFCPTCFQVYPPTLPNDAVSTCVKCYSHSHSHCVETAGAPPPNPYVCPLCVNPNSPVFKLKPAKEAANAGGAATVVNGRVMDRDAAKMLLAAAKIASTSMNKAAVAAKAEAERRVKEAAYTRKRAKEALEHVAHMMIKEKARRKEAALGVGHTNVVGRGFGGGAVGNGNGYTAPPGKIGTEITANRNGSTAIVPSVSRPLVVVEDKIGNAGNVDRENSNQVTAALNAVELRETEKMGVGVTSQGEDNTPMDVDESGMRPNDGEHVRGPIQDSSTDYTNLSDLKTGAGNVSNLEGLNSEIVPVHPTGNKEDENGGEHVNCGPV